LDGLRVFARRGSGFASIGHPAASRARTVWDTVLLPLLKENAAVARGRKRGSISKPRLMDAEVLREILKPIYDELVEAGVEEAQLPSNEALISKLLHFLDQNAVSKWVKEYAALMKG
jgi:hypothetical protein